MHGPPLSGPEWLEQKYHGEGMTQREIAEMCGVSPRTIRTYMERFEIETRAVEIENHSLYGKERSEEVKKRISEKLTGREVPEATRKKISNAQRGQSTPPEIRQTISNSFTGFERPRETREKMSRSTAGELNPN